MVEHSIVYWIAYLSLTTFSNFSVCFSKRLIILSTNDGIFPPPISCNRDTTLLKDGRRPSCSFQHWVISSRQANGQESACIKEKITSRKSFKTNFNILNLDPYLFVAILIAQYFHNFMNDCTLDRVHIFCSKHINFKIDTISELLFNSISWFIYVQIMKCYEIIMITFKLTCFRT